jgi:hypothetical protein
MTKAAWPGRRDGRMFQTASLVGLRRDYVQPSHRIFHVFQGTVLTVRCSTDSGLRYVISAGVIWVQLYLPRCVARLCDSAKLTTTSMSLPTSIPSSPRSTRPLAARKQANDPAWFSTSTTSVTSVKRQAIKRMEGEPRNKRKRVVEPTLQTPSQVGHRGDKLQERQSDELPVVGVFGPGVCCPPEAVYVSPGPHESRPYHPSVNKGEISFHEI